MMNAAEDFSLHDHHSHPLLYASFMAGVDLSNVKSLEQCKDLISKAGKETDFVVAFGWKDNFFQFDPSIDSLPPTAIFNLSLHNLVVNQTGNEHLFKMFGPLVNKLSDRHWFEANFRLVLNWFAKLNGSPQALLQFFNHLETLGIQSAEELLLVDEEEIRWFQEAGLTDRTRFWAAPETYAGMALEQKDQVAGIKLFTDGALGVRTAALNHPYCDLTDSEPNSRGILMYSDTELTRLIDNAADLRKGIAIHAIGDRALEQLASCLEAIGRKVEQFLEIRIEHAQLLTASVARRLKALKATLSMQPNFSTDSCDYIDRLGEHYASINNPFRMLIDEVGFAPGVDLIFGSDGMPHGIEPALAATQNPPFESQRLSRDELIAGYTR